MTKVVYNAYYGGFGLSKEACKRYWELQGKEVWIEDLDWGFTVWLVSPEERVVKPESWYSAPLEERIAYNRKHSEQTWYDRDVSRHDPILVQVVEELGDKANGMYAKLDIEEVYGPYKIQEYDGYETVETPGGCDWITP